MRLRPAYEGYGNPSAIDAYLQQEQPRRNGDYFSNLYGRTKEWFIEKPYKGFGALGAILGGISTLAFGPLGVLLGAAVGSSVLGGMGASYYWAWGRGKRIPNNIEFLKGRSLGKWYADYIQTMGVQARSQSTG